MPFLLAEILNFQGSTHRIGVGSFSHLNVTIPLLRDYELLKDGYYEETEGIVVGGEFNDTTEAMRDIIIEKQDDEDRFRVTIYSTPIEKGEYVKVHYLPNSHVGEVIERSGNTDLEE